MPDFMTPLQYPNKLILGGANYYDHMRRRLPLRLWGLRRLWMRRMRRGLVGSLWRRVCRRRRLLHILGRLQLLLGALLGMACNENGPALAASQ
jgi:hypothetical protein